MTDDLTRITPEQLARGWHNLAFGKLAPTSTRYDPEWIQRFIGDPCDDWSEICFWEQYVADQCKPLPPQELE